MTHPARTSRGFFEGIDRLRLHYRLWEADEPRAGVLVVHGLFEHSRRYEEVGRSLAEDGFSTFALDLRGHGASEGRRGHTRRFEILLQDLDRFRREVEGLSRPGLPLFIIGHSLGGLITLRYLEEYDTPLRGAIITSPWLGTAVAVPRWQVLLANALERVLPALPFRFRLDAASLTHDPDRVTDYQDDPHIHTTITPRMFTQISSAIHLALQRGDRIDLPVHFLLAGDDLVVDTSRSLAFARSLPDRFVTVEVLEGQYHEVFQEVDRERLVTAITDWMEDRLE
jgi:alpha-beta hydrolase superfamily lysophospholipase